jgi:hypothetical protein
LRKENGACAGERLLFENPDNVLVFDDEGFLAAFGVDPVLLDGPRLMHEHDLVGFPEQELDSLLAEAYLEAAVIDA